MKWEESDCKGCGYAPPGTYGHECRRPTVVVRTIAVDKFWTGIEWKNNEFMETYCVEHAIQAGRSVVPYAGQINYWRTR